MWTIHQSTGLVEDFKGFRYGAGYLGRGEGKNNPILQDVRAGCRLIGGEWIPVEGLSGDDWGPMPSGIYLMQAPIDTETHGPFVIWLTPGEGNEMFGRSGFGIHGDRKNSLQMASEGCLVVPHATRVSMWASNDLSVQVIP